VIEIKFTGPAYRQLQEYLFQGDGLERAAYGFAGLSYSDDRTTLTVRELWTVPPEAYVHQTGTGVEVAGRYVKQVLAHAFTSGLSLLEMHSHPFAFDQVGFSNIDEADERQKFPYVAGRIPGIRHGTMVFGRQSVDAHLYDPAQRTTTAVDHVTVLEAPLRRLIPTGARRGGAANPGNPNERYSRQVVFFGEAGQKMLRDLKVGIVGLGSVGMLVAQQLVYLGVRHFVLVDNDHVEASNLNRLVGATPGHAKRRTLKVTLARRLLTAAAPDARVEALPLPVTNPRAHQALKTVDVLFGCVDTAGGRLVVNDRLAVQYLIPYIDVGTGLEAAGDGRLARGGAWVRCVMPGERCLHCIGAIDPEQAARDLLPPAERERARAGGYISNAEVAAPSVIFLNATAASLAVAEFFNLVIGYKPAAALVMYDLFKQRAAPVEVRPREHCASCDAQALLALGDLEPFPHYDVGAPAPPASPRAAPATAVEERTRCRDRSR